MRTRRTGITHAGLVLATTLLFTQPLPASTANRTDSDGAPREARAQVAKENDARPRGEAARTRLAPAAVQADPRGYAKPDVWTVQEERDARQKAGSPAPRTIEIRKGSASTGPVLLTGVPVAEGRTADFRLEPFDVFAPEARIVAMEDGRELPLPRPDATFYQGRSNGGDVIFLSLQHGRIRAFLQHEGETSYIAPAPEGEADDHLLVPGKALPPMPVPAENYCGADLLPENGAFLATWSEEEARSKAAAASTARLETDLMIDVDNSLYRSVFGSNTNTAATYVGELIGSVSAIYERDLNVQLRISALTIWTTPDPFGASDARGQLDAYEDYVRENRAGVMRDLAHLLANGKVTNYGGIAYLDALCSANGGYGVDNIYGTADFAVSGYQWDIFVLSHELGHNFGSPHTHCYSPPIDQCYASQSGCYDGPVVPTRGTIMSYCHLTPAGTNLVFHPRVAAVMRSEAEGAACLSEAGGGGRTTPVSCGQTISASLATSDPRSTVRTSSYADTYSFSGTAGARVTITMSSSAVDAYLVLKSPSGSIVAQDDDGNGDTNSKIVHTPSAGGVFTIEATSSDPDETGAYTIELSCGGAAVTLVDEGAEGGGPGWSTPSNSSSKWLVETAGASRSGSGHFRSNGTTPKYPDSTDQSLVSPVFSLAGRTSATLSYYYKYRTESGFDFFCVEISTDDGVTWTELERGSGKSGGWPGWAPQADIDLTPHVGSSACRVRFRLTSDEGVTARGAAVDDIVVTAQ